MKRILQLLAILLVSGFANAQIVQQMTEGVLTGSNGTIHFLYYLPGNYRPTGTSHPLIISLAGVGERGDGSSLPNGELINLYEGGIPLKIAKGGFNMVFTYNGYTEGFIVMAPQICKTCGWQNYYVDEMINYATSHFNVDPTRIFLTGYSLGGTGSWQYALTSPNVNKLAGVVPISAGTPPGANYCNPATNNVAIWAFQGQNDEVYGGTTAHDMAVQVNGCSPAIPAMDTIYPNEVHGADFWNTKVYDLGNTYHYPNVFQWMLKISRSLNPATDQNPVPVISNGSVINLQTPVKFNELPQLAGINSTDADDIIVSYLWEMRSGASSSALNSQWPNASIYATGTGTAAIAPEQGAYTFRLWVKDYLTSRPGHTQFKDVTLNINYPASGHTAPAIDIGSNRTITTSTDQQLATVYFYPCGGCGYAGYNWSIVSAPAGSSVELRDWLNPNNPYCCGGQGANFVGMNVNGNYVFKFTANSSAGDPGSQLLTITRTGALLPVTYSFINAVNAGNKNVISWATSAEVNSDRFDVQRSADGVSFSTIGTVRASGNSSGTINYNFDDNNPLPGLSYYRLAQVDKDGKVNLSKTISVSGRVSGLVVTTFPNPVHDNINLAIQSSTNGRVQLVVADMQGKTLLKQEWQKETTSLSRQLNLSGLQSGVYQLVIIVGSEKHISSLVKY